MTRDRASALAAAIKEILPDAMQVADRFHLYKNLMDTVRNTILRELPENIPVCEEENQIEIHDTEKKTTNEDNTIPEKQTELTDGEKSRRDKIIKVQNFLKDGYSGTDIMKIMSTSARFIRTYKKAIRMSYVGIGSVTRRRRRNLKGTRNILQSNIITA